MSKERIQWIDNEKGFILLGVCIGHIGFTWNVFPYISTFHMAAFFFLSGLLFRTDRPWIKFALSKCKTLLLPYITLSFFFLFLTPSLYQLEMHYTGSTLQNNMADILSDNDYFHSLIVQLQIYLLDIINGYSAPFVTPLWFVYTLFQLNIIWFFPIRWLKEYKYSSYLLGAIAVICFVSGWMFYMNDITLPLQLSTFITSSSFFIVGYLFKQHTPYLSNLSVYWLAFLIIPLSFIYFIGVTNLKSPCIGYITNLLDENILAYAAASWGGTLVLTLLFIFLNKLNINLMAGHILRAISINGISILALHNYILSSMRWGANTFHMPALANHWIIAIAIIVLCCISIPIINRYFYFIVGKKAPEKYDS